MNVTGNRSVFTYIYVIICFTVNTNFSSLDNKYYQISIWYFSAKYVALRSNSKDLLARKLDNVSEVEYMSTCRLENPAQGTGLL